MATWAVYHLIHVRTPHQHIPKLVIREVPEGVDVDPDLVTRAGYQFGEFDIPWANHVLEAVDVHDSPADLVASIRRGDCETLTYVELVDQAEAEL